METDTLDSRSEPWEWHFRTVVLKITYVNVSKWTMSALIRLKINLTETVEGAVAAPDIFPFPSPLPLSSLFPSLRSRTP